MFSNITTITLIKIDTKYYLILLYHPVFTLQCDKKVFVIIFRMQNLSCKNMLFIK